MRGKSGLIAEAKGHMIHKIAPTLQPSIEGLFSVVISGIFRNHAEIHVRLVNRAREVVKDFGHAVVPLGGAVIIDQFCSDLTITPNAPSIPAYFQAWFIGTNKDNTEAEISLRLVDEDRKEIINFGSAVRRPGIPITLEGMDIKCNILTRH